VSRRAVVVVLLAILLTSASCGEGVDAFKDEVRGALARTKRLARSFVYTERSATGEIAVRGIVDDDYRYKAQLSVAGRPAAEEVAIDDALAVRYLDSNLAREVVARPSAPVAVGSAGAIAPSAASSGRELEALLARRWVVDPYGAPELVVSRAGAERRVGDDPILDGLTVLSYVGRAIDEAPLVARFNEESVAYQAEEDVFPVPKKGSGVLRYDIGQPPLPRPSRSGAGAAQGAPQTSHFRRMAIYMKDGLVVQVREAIFPVRRQLEHLAEFYDIDVGTENLAQAGEQAIASLNRLRAGAGEQQIRTRTMSFELFDLAQTRRIALPSDAIRGNLDILSGRGRTSPTGGT
jgi:hypothetical protein